MVPGETRILRTVETEFGRRHHSRRSRRECVLLFMTMTTYDLIPVVMRSPGKG